MGDHLHYTEVELESWLETTTPSFRLSHTPPLHSFYREVDSNSLV